MSTQSFETPAGMLFSLLFMGAVAFGVQQMAAQPHVFGASAVPAETEVAAAPVQDDDLAVKIFLHQNAGL